MVDEARFERHRTLSSQPERYLEYLVTLRTYLPTHFLPYGIPYACYQIADAMSAHLDHSSVFGISVDSTQEWRNVQTLFPRGLASRAGHRLLGMDTLRALSVRRFMRQVRAGDAVYLWPDLNLEMVRELKRRGHPIIVECINTRQGTAKHILDAECERLGLPTEGHGISQQKIDLEDRTFSLCDYFFAPSPAVARSLSDANIPDDRIILTSYGLTTAKRKPAWLPKPPASDGLRVLFAGSMGIRKGILHALETWAAADIKGQLILAGLIEDPIRARIEPFLERPDILHVGFVDDLPALMDTVDLMIFPSLEEGSPLVTYDALGRGVPCLGTEMGGGGIIQHGENGLVLELTDRSAWVDALRHLDQDRAFLAHLQQQSWVRSEDYLWSKVGAQRAAALASKLVQWN